MRGWRTKFIGMLIVYFAGFATAIYALAPAPENKVSQVHDKTSIYSALKSDDFVQSFNTGIHKCLAFGKDAALRTAKLIKEKAEDKPGA
ncbi:MAG: hypothetical protein ABIF19_00805 [Planctomycetota bacterium]